MKTHLFLFTISPVQSFIAQARKTQDLYAGSRILSDLVKQAMQELKNLCANTEFIFPTDINSESKPNRFTAIVKTDKDIQEIGNKVKTNTECYFVKTLGKKVLDLQPDGILQLNDFLKIYWIATDFKENEPYAPQIKQAEKYLGATKNIRYFSQLEEKGRKCALNGEYNVKFYRLGDNEQKNDKLYDKKLFTRSVLVLDNTNDDEQKIPSKFLQEGEGLCAVSMLKRFFPIPEGFPSTAKIALLDTLNKNQIAQNYIDIIRSLNRGYADEQIYYEENLTQKYLQKQGYKKLYSDLGYKNLKENFDRMKNSVKDDKLVLSKYYAILVFDADGMGKKLEKCQTKEEHQKLSELLGDYGKSATKYINDNNFGKTIYAGGDDFLGFLNLNHLFDAMQELRRLFDIQVNTHLPDNLKPLTFSAGIAIAHYKTPLSEVLTWARAMEKKAKKVENIKDEKVKKDAFSIAVLKHSGEIHDTTFRWKDENCHWSTEVLKTVTNHLKNKDISDKFITNLSETFAKLLDENGGWGEKTEQKTKEKLNEIFEKELLRFAKRAKTEDGGITDIKSFCDKLYALYKNNCAFDLNVQNFLNALHICEFISRHLNKTKN